MTSTRILCNIPMDHVPQAKGILESFAGVTYAHHNYRDLVAAIGDYDALLPSLDVFLDEPFFQAARRLKVIATPSTGTDHIDLGSAKSHGVAVFSLKNDTEFLRKVTATAELAMGLMLSIVRHLPFAFDSVRAGQWDREAFRGRELLDKTLGIIGYGRLGEMVSRYGHAFGMSVLACDPYKQIGDDWVHQVDMDTLLRSADIISIHVHLNDETKGLLSRRAFSLIKPGAYLVNTSRGAVIDEDALLEALASGRLAGAAVDVITNELQGDFDHHPLIRYARQHDNLIISPHMGGVTFESQAKAMTFTAEKVRRFFTAPPAVP